MRVPALLVSPWVGAGSADPTVYDHTSLPATLKKMLGLPDFLTARDAAANTFDGNFLSAARSVSLTNLAARVPPATGADRGGDSGRRLSSHQRSLLALAQTLARPPADARVTCEAVSHARALLDAPQGP